MSAPSSAIESNLVENRVFFPTEAQQKAARISGMEGYNALCAEAEKDTIPGRNKNPTTRKRKVSNGV